MFKLLARLKCGDAKDMFKGLRNPFRNRDQEKFAVYQPSPQHMVKPKRYESWTPTVGENMPQ